MITNRAIGCTFSFTSVRGCLKVRPCCANHAGQGAKEQEREATAQHAVVTAGRLICCRCPADADLMLAIAASVHVGLAVRQLIVGAAVHAEFGDTQAQQLICSSLQQKMDSSQAGQSAAYV
jgi:hypothetical protein